MKTIRNTSLLICFLCCGAASSISRAAAAPDAAPSFSCTTPRLSPTETQICGNAELAGYDRELAGLYQAKLQAAAPLDKQQVVQSQQVWLQKRNACGGSPDCIKGAYLTKIYGLQTITVPTAHSEQADQINAAVPLSSEAQTALSDMRHRVDDKTTRAKIDAQLTLKMQLRALSCEQSLGIRAGLSSQDIHDQYGGSPCFAQQDDDIANWLGLRTVGYMLALPPLRPLPATPPQNITDGAAPIRKVFFAAQAGVAALESQKDVEVIDLARGTPISSLFGGDGLSGISPNGRVYIAPDNRRRGRIGFYDSQDNSVLADPEWNQYGWDFIWLDAHTTLTRDTDSRLPEVYDFSSGATVPLDGILPLFYWITPVPGASGTFVGFADSGITEFKLVTGTDGKLQVQVVLAKQLRLELTTYGTGGLVPGGRQYVYIADKKLALTDLGDLRTDMVDLGDLFEPQLVVPTSDPDKVIVGGVRKGSLHVGMRGALDEWQLYEYTLKEQTLSLLDTSAERAGIQTGLEFYYDSAQNTLYTLRNAGSDTTLIRGQIMAGESPVSLAEFVAAATRPQAQPPNRYVPSRPNPNGFPPGTVAVTLNNGRIDKIYDGESSQPVQAPPNTVAVSTAGGEINKIYVAPTQPVPGNISQLSPSADVEGIGIVESGMATVDAPDAATTLPSGSPTAKVVHVMVRARRNPVILVLSSHTSVEWQLDIKSGARLSAVLLSGSNGSSVQGQGDVPVAAIGSAYGYAIGTPGYAALQNEVYNYTGKRMTLFQGGGADTQFNVY